MSFLLLWLGADIAEKGKEGVFFGTLQGAHFLGIGFGPLISGVLTDHFGWHVPFYFMTALTALALVMVIKKTPVELTAKPSSSGQMLSSIGADIELCASYMFLLPILLCHVSGHNAHGHSPLAAGLSLSFSQIGIILSLNSLTTGVLQRYFGNSQTRYPGITLIIMGVSFRG